jgi:hypothetical protein
MAALVIAAGGLLIAPLSVRAEIPPPTPPSAPPSRPSLPSLPSSPSFPPPHLGYGMNVRNPGTVESLFAPLGFEWLKLWEEYGTEENPTLPQIRYPYQVLFLIDCTKKTGDLDAWGDAVEVIATAGRGLVEAYEICNEPNRAEWLGTHVSPDQPPDPGLYVAMLQVAYERIKAIDPAAIVVSAGLAPVGRIRGTCNSWSGNDCNAMDEREYARQMILLGAGDYLDAFGYHPYGFAYEPERALDELPPADDGNGFAFRGVEVMHDLLEQHGLDDKPVWATEFSWLRDPNEDGAIPGWCHRLPEYENSVGWMDVPEVQQADYITRAFRYADENWPWMGTMFVWNLDWYDYGWLCDPARYFSVLKIDYTDYHPLMDPGELILFTEYSASLSRGRPMQREAALDQPAPYTTTLAYEALAAMEKRPAGLGPRLAVVPPALSFLADVDKPGPLTRVVVPLNAGFGVFTWTATVAVGMQVTPTLAITTGFQGTPLTVTVDSTGYSTGTFTGVISVTSTTTGVLDAPQAVPVTLLVVPEVYGVYLPLALRSAP